MPRIVWSYPADGQDSVPTNARVFFLTSNGPFEQGTVEINGQPVQRTPGDVRFGLPAALAPLSEYVVTVSSGTAQGYPLSFKFKTSAGAVEVPKPTVPVVDRRTPMGTRALSPACKAAWQAMDCFDTGQNTHLVFETASRPLLFYVEPLSGGGPNWFTLWPGVCGDPEIFVGDEREGLHCAGPHRLHAVSLTGEETTADVACPPLQSAAPGGGCAIAGRVPGRAPLALLLVALVGAVRPRWRSLALVALAVGLLGCSSTSLKPSDAAAEPGP